MTLLTRSTQLAQPLSQRVAQPCLGATLNLDDQHGLVCDSCWPCFLADSVVSRSAVGSDAWPCRPAGELGWCWARLSHHSARLFRRPGVVLALILSAGPELWYFALLAITYGVLFAVAIGFSPP